MHAIARVVLAVAASVGLSSVVPSLCEAKVLINIDLDSQTMHVQGQDKSFDIKVSSGKPGYETPAGAFKVLWMDKEHHSDTYDDAYMPDAIFFAPGYAIHGFGKSPWGHKASHGCVRIPMAKAAELFDMVKAEGADITITGQSPVTMATIRTKLQEKNAGAAANTRAPTKPEPRYEDARGYAASAGYGAPQYADEVQQGYDDPRNAAPPSQPTARDGFFGSFY